MKKRQQRPTLNRQRLVRLLGQRTRLPNQVSAHVVETLVNILSDEIAVGGRIEISNFLTLEVETRSRAVIMTNSEEDTEPIRQTYCVLKCRPGKRLRARLHTLARKTHSIK